jgi:serine/threonine protein kinase
MEAETRLGGGRYAVRRVLGEGAQGVTYEAADAQTGRAVAIKRFDVRGARTWKDVELAERETRVLSTLDHPLVPRYIEHFEEEGALYLVMEKVEGETLDAIRQREGALPEAEVRRFLACADRALTYLHGRGSPVVHRDVKPRNVVRRPDGTYVLVDFGAVRELLARRGSTTIVGTMGYMAPEQFQGRALPATDVYAVGATALAALTGVEPEALPHRGLRIDVRAALQGRTSPELVSTLERMLEPDPDERAPSLATALDGVSMPPARAPTRTDAPEVVPRRDTSDSEALHNEALAKSVRGLLWVLWGLGWILVPLVLSALHVAGAIPIVMFGSLAALLILTWNKNTLLRAALRRVQSQDARPHANTPAGTFARPRVDVGQVRVRTSDLAPEEMVADTEVKSTPPPKRAARP